MATLKEVLAALPPGLIEAVAHASRVAPVISAMEKAPKPVRAAILKAAREENLADDPVIKQITSDIDEANIQGVGKKE